MRTREAAEVLKLSYEAFARVVRSLDEDASWAPSGCTGWAVRDLVFHCLMDAQRGLVALHTPARGPVDRDAVTYWADSRPGTDGAANGRRYARVCAGMFREFDQLRGLYLETAAATVVAAGRAEPDRLVGTQGHVLSASDLLETLTVEATVHHLDLVAPLPDAPGPSDAGLARVRTVLDGLLGHPVPLPWSDEHYARAATGRLSLSPEERELLGADADRFPVFG
ncbi:maleylpyruvate isomerase N-terminal domain-containing protein [Streptomyces sp. NPDC007088]|uniref:maleylpyruvate isomerase N-terminal domain-containing protein n=1 Tax=Streptomyces sp. NPDC007088 TaxID=3364773 RepID=UPI003684D1F9